MASRRMKSTSVLFEVEWLSDIKFFYWLTKAQGISPVYKLSR